ncbi:MAG TPA: hypothetical protein VK043_04435, partial [Burkholderiales bacterium]|nr:hypothetical protein [Burkholderiales bacterium]
AVDRGLRQRAWTEAGGEAILEQSLPALEAGTITPYEVAERIVRAAVGVGRAGARSSSATER